MACPVGYSIPDYLLDLASDVDLCDTSSAPNRDRTSVAKVEINVPGELVRRGTSSRPIGGGNAWRSGSCSATFLTQFEAICAREWRNLIRFACCCCVLTSLVTSHYSRDKTLFYLHVGISAVLGVFCGALFLSLH